MFFPSSNNTSNSHLSLKLALISTAILSLAILLKLTFPSLTHFTISEFPIIYSSALSWLRPPYLYLIINGIIISIVASSKLQIQKPNKEHFKPSEVTIPQVIVETKRSSQDLLTEFIDEAVMGGTRNLYEDCIASKGNLELENVKTSNENDLGLCKSEKGTNISSSTPLRSESLEILFEKFEKEKPLLSARFAHKKSLKASSTEGKATGLGVTKSKRNDTLENAWKMVTDGRAMPLTRHLKKSDTWETHLHRDETKLPCPPLPEKMKKSETFSERRSKLGHKINRQPSGKLKKEPSLSQDELNRRVEAFIKKFNEEMRLQRQESLNQFQEMISRGV